MSKYIFVATLDKETCSICGKLDGKEFDESDKKIGVNYPPMHEGCRCVTIQTSKSELRKTTRIARDPLTGKNQKIKYISYSKWWKKYSQDISKKFR